MDSKLVLVKIITLLYCEGLCNRITERSNQLAKDIIAKLKLPEQISEADTGRNVIVGLRETILWMIEQPGCEPYEYNSLLQRVRLNADDDFAVFQAFEDVQSYHETNDEQLMKICSGMESELRNFLHQWAIRELINKAHRELFYANKPIDWRQYVDGLVADLETYAGSWSKDQATFALNIMNMADPETLASVLEKARDDTEGVGGLKSGWQAFNRMLGESGQLRRGMTVLIGALTHNYKSGLTHDLFRHACLYNDPVPDHEGGKPLLLYCSSENRAEEDLMRMYVALKENETGEAVDVSMVNEKDAAEYVSRRLTERGWEVVMMRIDPGSFTYTDLFNLILKYESNGYEVHGCFFDYLGLINRAGCHSSMIGEDMRQLLQKVRVFMSARNILFVTPHQLSQEAMTLKRQGTDNFVQEIAGKNYWDGSKRIANEADLEIFCDIVERDKKHYLAIHRGKHRTVKATPVKYRFFYLPFQEVGYIPEDINKEDSSLTSLTAVGADLSMDF